MPLDLCLLSLSRKSPMNGLTKLAKHQHLDHELIRSLRKIEKLEGVTKIVLGRKDNCRHKYTPGYLRCMQPIDGGLRLNGYSGRGVQSILVFTDGATTNSFIQTILDKQ